MTLTELRYYYEHKILPKYYFEDTVPFLAEIFEAYGDSDGEGKIDNFLYDMIRELAEKNGIAFPYSEDQYKVDMWKLDEDNFMIRLRMPEPDETVLCSYVYLLFPIEDFSQNRYFTVELTEIKKKRKYYCLCEWDKEGVHKNYGYLPNNIEQVEDKIIKLFYQ